jgi:hypothetical protein
MAGHAAWAATHVDDPSAAMQHPPFAQLFPSQHGCPEPPHAVHMPIEHASAGSLQKSLALPPPLQHCCPAAPHTTVHVPAVHVPPPPQRAASATQLPVSPSQQPLVHVSPAQHG